MVGFVFFFNCIYLFFFFFIFFVFGLCCAFLAAHGLSLIATSGGYTLWWVVHRLLIAVVSLVVVHRLSCPAACGIFLDQETNPCPQHRQVDS